MSVLAALAAAAVALTIAAWCYLRWRENLAVASARVMRYASRRGEPLPGLGPFESPEFWMVAVTALGGALAVAAVSCWIALLRGLVRGENGTLMLRLATDPAGIAALAICALLFAGLGLHHLLFRSRWATLYHWLCDTEAPLDDSQPPPDYHLDGDSRRRWVTGAVFVGVYLLSFAVVLALLDVKAAL